MSHLAVVFVLHTLSFPDKEQKRKKEYAHLRTSLFCIGYQHCYSDIESIVGLIRLVTSLLIIQRNFK